MEYIEMVAIGIAVGAVCFISAIVLVANIIRVAVSRTDEERYHADS
jgi:hypothetical protein